MIIRFFFFIYVYDFSVNSSSSIVTMAPNASPIFNLNYDNHAFHIRQNICHRYNFNNNSSILLKTRLKFIKKNFAAVNCYYLNENLIESVNNFTSSTVNGGEKDEKSWTDEMRYSISMRLELIRKMLVKQTIKEKLDAWQKQKDELLSRNKKTDVFYKPKFQREEILVKKENYDLILDQIQKRTNTERTIVFDHQQRTKEIFFKATLAKAVLFVNNMKNYFNNQQFLFNIGKQIDVYYSIETRLNGLKNIKVIKNASLIAARSLLEDLTSYINNVVTPIQAEVEKNNGQIDNKKNILKVFSVNTPDESIIKHVRRQYVALVKNNKALIKNLGKAKNVPFISDPTTKLFRQNLVKVINTLVNTISSTNAAHLNEKYNKLNSLLSGNLVRVANTQVMIGNNKEAMAFCMETLASKIINYAEEVISVKTRVAYEIAAVMSKLWVVHQQFGKILFAEMKQRCPLLVPFCYPVAKSLTVEQFDHKSFGYKFDSSGNVESHCKYIKRMTGIVRLFAAFILTSSKYDQPVIGLSQAWIFIAGTLNQNPVADITATILVEFLNIVSSAMHDRYGKQFFKLLRYISSHYIKKIILVTPAGNGGPITRLNSFLSKSLFIGSVDEPKGMLSSDFL